MDSTYIPNSAIVNLRSNQSLRVVTEGKSHKGYWMVSKPVWKNVSEDTENKQWELQGRDFIDEFVSMGKREQAAVKLIKDNIAYDTERGYYDFTVYIDKDVCELNNMVYSSFIKAYGLLKKRDFVRRVSKHTYMINPDVLIPSKEYALFKYLWMEAE